MLTQIPPAMFIRRSSIISIDVENGFIYAQMVHVKETRSTTDHYSMLTSTTEVDPLQRIRIRVTNMEQIKTMNVGEDVRWTYSGVEKTGEKYLFTGKLFESSPEDAPLPIPDEMGGWNPNWGIMAHRS